MPSYLFIASRDPFASRDVDNAYSLMMELAARGVEQISRQQLADFLNGFDLVWHW